jgi:hypothetical protein
VNIAGHFCQHGHQHIYTIPFCLQRLPRLNTVKPPKSLNARVSDAPFRDQVPHRAA